MTLKTFFHIVFMSFLFLASSSFAFATQNGIAVIELFTTQGCPACPAADRIFEDVVKQNNPKVLALTCHITYFDTPHWQDTLSQPFCDDRQGYYMHALKTHGMYTPQVIVNGSFQVVGNREDIVFDGIKRGQSTGNVTPVQVSLREDYLDITLPKMRLHQPANVFLFTYRKIDSVIISGGSNRGEALNYVHSVRDIIKLLEWNGRYVNMAFPINRAPADGYAILIQNEDYNGIIAAGWTER